MSEGDSHDAQREPAGGRPAVARWVARAKAHPVVVVLVTVVGIGSFLITAENVLDWGRDKVGAVTNPHAAEYELLASLDLDTRPEYFEEGFGVARRMYPLCDGLTPCEAGQDGSATMYVHETENVRVRAVFAGDQLKAYTITLRSAEVTPEMRWLDWSLGRLGESTYAGAFEGVETVDEPTDLDVYLGPQATAYAEVVSAGAPADHRGVLLGWAPGGLDGPSMAFDLDAARQLVDARAGNVEVDPGIVSRFRTSSTPNTFGEFRDDSMVGEQLQDADAALRLLLIGTDL